MKTLPLTLALALTLTGCSHAVFTPDQDALLNNPLYLEQFSEQMVDRMTNLEILQDPLLEDEAKAAIVDATKVKWLKAAKESRKQQRNGIKGTIIPMKEYVEGEVLYYNNQLHLAPHFVTAPGPNLHVFLSMTIDPRDVQFPDETALDLGQIIVPYGAQSFAVPTVDEPKRYRSVVIWDSSLDRLYGFAQVNPLY
tara:strand:+ start:395 stop:979 length:585 start_codon:yes stop_codon:yes gene_type:complete